MAVTYDADRAERVLRQATQAAVAPVLTDEEIEDLLWRARVTDSTGLLIDDLLWTPTYSVSELDAAAGRGWMVKASKVKDKIKVGIGTGLTFEDQQEYDHCIDMAERYGFTGGGSGGLSSVGIVTDWMIDV